MLRTTPRRWTREESVQRLASAPKFMYAPPNVDELVELARRYTDITGDPVRRERKRNYLAACYRVHGADTLPFIADEFGRTGTAVNLLGAIRCAPRRVKAAGNQPSQPTGDPETAATPPLWSAEEVRELLEENEVVARQTVADGEREGLAWRVSAMESQVPAHGPIPLLRARPELQLEGRDRCWSCGEPSDGDGPRCDLCIDAARVVIQAISREAARPQPALDGRCPSCQRTADEKVATLHVAGFCDVCGWTFPAKAS